METIDYSNYRPDKGLHRLNLPTEVVVALAIGADDPYNILTGYGFSERMVEIISTDPAIQKAVDAKRRELQREGYTFRLKAALAAEMLLDEVVTTALDPKATLATKHDVLKTLAKFGNLEPKEDKQAVAPTGFQVNIQIGNQTVQIGGKTPGAVVEIPAEIVEIDPETGEKTAFSALDFGIPDTLKVPDFMAKPPVLTPVLTFLTPENP